jgi:aminopeptidase N
MRRKVTRLFEQFRPEHYQLELQLDTEAMKFHGTVTINGQKTGRPSKRLTFHQNGLKITAASVIRHDKKGEQKFSVDRINHHGSFDEVRLHTKEKLFPGKFSVQIAFSGNITKPMNGIYPCFFKHDGQDKKLIATQFESHHAREVFPCIDEPEAKATYDLILTTPAGDTVLANTPIKKSSAINSASSTKLQKTTFETTPKMSTYLLAFIYGDLRYKEASTKDGVVVRTYATPDNVAFTEFALDMAVKCLEFYNDYFGTKYPLPKCDLIALPDFASGAMENWGCITYREQCMLFDQKNSSLPNKQYVAMVVAHELAHQWFGNLVTMRWWTDLWLNEGFASWIEYLAVDHIFPEWQMWTQFIVDEQQRGLSLDALEYTHPVEVPVRHPDEIRTIFDTISYSKGASVIHMLHQYLGKNDFRDGLRHYLKRHAYSNTDTVDLWIALEEISGKPVKDFMHAWTSQSGFPVVQAEVTGKTVKLSQQRFYINPQARDTSTKPVRWPVALLAGQEAPEALNQTKAEFSINDTGNFKLNYSQSGFYRVTYDASHQKQLAKCIAAGQLGPLDRLGILSDAFEAAKAGYGSTVNALTLLESYQNEDNSAVWDVIAGSLGSIRLLMDDETLRENMKPYTRQLVSKQLRRLGWAEKKNESYFDKLLRPTILGMASVSEEPNVIGEALKRFNSMNIPEDVHPNLRGVIYGTAARHGGQAEFDKLWKMYTETTLSEERTTITAAITGFKQPAQIKKALGLIDSRDVRLQDATYWVAYSFMNRHARNASWDWLTEHWNWLEKNLGHDLSFYRFPIYAARPFSDPKFLPIFRAFFDPKRSPAFERPINQAIEIIQYQSAWRERDLNAIKTFFKNAH